MQIFRVPEVLKLRASCRQARELIDAALVWTKLDDRAVYCSCQKQTSYTFRGYVLRRDVTKFQGYTLLAV